MSQTMETESTRIAPQEPLRKIVLVCYVLYAASLFVGVTGIVAIVVNYLKRTEAEGTWLESHFTWQIKTFWYSLLIGVVAFITFFFLIGWFVAIAGFVWFIYRIVKGFLAFNEGKPVA
ncbi:DUF4870 family protein [Desulfocurvibacter africanus]|uniref:DUF4870 family protein n=1 Tax=Desulfocurvibacter africanus TaxID=873 RepID=UPI0003FA760B|nr:membrane protein [Desulfocurvibacter africanus]